MSERGSEQVCVYFNVSACVDVGGHVLISFCKQMGLTIGIPFNRVLV